MEWPSQKIIHKLNLEQKYFAEGIAASFSNNILYQLTYKEREILLYSFPDMEYKNKIKMPGEMKEGWGLCAGKEKDEFFATDGSDKIFVLKKFNFIIIPNCIQIIIETNLSLDDNIFIIFFKKIIFF